mmetsp:Transcript_33075/g.71594  ORF Transcript_33075/g.71594 Transcript_33075/m.71594 type:complete len:215 (-) Transcript_33075:88-732(-)
MQHIFRGADEGCSGFGGNEDDYYAYENSLIDEVINTAKGIPITLSILYAAIVRRATGVIMNPLGLPGHFILGTQPDEDGRTYKFIDAFRRGEILNAEQVKEIVVSYGRAWNDGLIRATAPYREVWARMLRNLIAAHNESLRDQLVELRAAMPSNAAIQEPFRQLLRSRRGQYHTIMRGSIVFLCPETLHAFSADEAVGRLFAFERATCVWMMDR